MARTGSSSPLRPWAVAFVALVAVAACLPGAAADRAEFWCGGATGYLVIESQKKIKWIKEILLFRIS